MSSVSHGYDVSTLRSNDTMTSSCVVASLRTGLFLTSCDLKNKLYFVFKNLKIYIFCILYDRYLESKLCVLFEISKPRKSVHILVPWHFIEQHDKTIKTLSASDDVWCWETAYLVLATSSDSDAMSSPFLLFSNY